MYGQAIEICIAMIVESERTIAIYFLVNYNRQYNVES